jgi:hypothetical protein
MLYNVCGVLKKMVYNVSGFSLVLSMKVHFGISMQCLFLFGESCNEMKRYCFMLASAYAYLRGCWMGWRGFIMLVFGTRGSIRVEFLISMVRILSSWTSIR